MKLTMLNIIILIFTTNIYATTDTIYRPSEILFPETKDFSLKQEAPFRGHVAGIYGGFIDFVNTDYGDYSGKDFMSPRVQTSYSIALNIIQVNIGLQRKRNNIGLVAGFGAEWQNIEFEHKLTIRKNADEIIEPVTFADQAIKRSRLRQLNLQIPVFLEFQVPAKSKQRVHLGVGAVGVFRLLSQTKFKSTDVGTPYRYQYHKQLNNYNIRDYRIDLMAQVGINYFCIWVRYGLTPLFYSKKGPEIHSLNFGVGIPFSSL